MPCREFFSLEGEHVLESDAATPPVSAQHSGSDAGACEVLWEEPFGCLCADSGCLASVSSQTESLYFPASLTFTEGYLENEAERARGVWEAPNTSVACYISILCSAVRPVYDDEQVLIPVTSRQVIFPLLCMTLGPKEAEIDPLSAKQMSFVPTAVMALGQNIEGSLGPLTSAVI